MVKKVPIARDCIYEEAKACLILGLVKLKDVKKQMEKYKREGFPAHFGLSENNIILRRHNGERVIKLMEDWWKELNLYTHRDQLSLAYVLWKNGEKFNFMEESARNESGYFEYRVHKVYKNRSLIAKAKDKIKINIRKLLYKW